MLLQSQHGELHLLPAIPDVWSAGKVTGLVGRGGFVVDISWGNNRLQNAQVLSKIGGVCTIRTNTPAILQGVNAESKPAEIGHIISFRTEKGRKYILKSK
jgi:alpha-L-fucosidase 2